MAIRSKTKAPVNSQNPASEIPRYAKAKLTVSYKMRTDTGVELFFAPGIEMDCTPDTLEATQAIVSEKVQAWLDQLTESFEGSLGSSEDEDEDETEEESEEESEDEDETENEDEDEEETLTEEDIRKMKKADLVKLIEDYELEIDTSGLKIADIRDAVIDALSDESEDEDEDDEDDEDETDEEDEDDEDEDDEDEDEVLTEEELSEMKLTELQDICNEWEIGDPPIKKGAKLAAKKAAYIKHILENQE